MLVYWWAILQHMGIEFSPGLVRECWAYLRRDPVITTSLPLFLNTIIHVYMIVYGIYLDIWCCMWLVWIIHVYIYIYMWFLNQILICTSFSVSNPAPFCEKPQAPHHIVGHEARVGGVLRKATIQVGLHLRNKSDAPVIPWWYVQLINTPKKNGEGGKFRRRSGSVITYSICLYEYVMYVCI